MPVHLQRALDALRQQILVLGGRVEEAVWKAVQAFTEIDPEVAEQVVAADREIDQMEVDVEEECLKILALHQPVAVDLRFIVAVLKINNDLERIGDLAVNISQRAVRISRHVRVEEPFDLTAMATVVQGMLHDSLDALVNMDSAAARDVCRRDDEVDRRHRQIVDRAGTLVRERSEWFDGLVQIISVSGHLERIADLATNIAEDVIYTVEGQIVRHGVDRRATGEGPGRRE